MNKFIRISQVDLNSYNYLERADRTTLLGFAVQDAERVLKLLKQDQGFYDLQEAYKTLGGTIEVLMRLEYPDIMARQKELENKTPGV